MSMVVEQPLKDTLLAHFDQQDNRLAPQHLLAARASAREAFQQEGFPLKHIERWKYSSTFALSQQTLSCFTKDGSLQVITSEDINNWRVRSDSTLLVMVDHCFDASLSTAIDQADGLQICSSLDLTGDEQAKLFQTNRQAQHGFSALNQGCFSDGLFLKIKQDARLTKPVEILHIQTKPSQLINHRHMIRLEQGAHACVIEQTIDLNQTGSCLNQHMNLYQEASSELTYYGLGSSSSETLVQQIQAIQDAHSKGQYFFHHGQASWSRRDINIDLTGERANCAVHGLTLLSGTAHHDDHVHISHQGIHQEAKVHYTNLLSQKTTGVFNGTIEVPEIAKDATAHMTNHNLMLSNDAVMNTKPELEIYTHDVTCSHGATIGQLDEEALFYAQTRGISLVEARELLVAGVVEDHLGHYPDEWMTTHLRRHFLPNCRIL